MLTRRQKEALDYISGRIQETGGVSPSYQEIADALCISSKGEISRLVQNLEERGRLRRLGHRKRALEVIPERIPHGAVPVVSYPNAKYSIWDDEAKALVPLKRGKP